MKYGLVSKLLLTEEGKLICAVRIKQLSRTWKSSTVGNIAMGWFTFSPSGISRHTQGLSCKNKMWI